MKKQKKHFAQKKSIYSYSDVKSDERLQDDKKQ